ncbi:MAG: hypothetical protein JSW23_04155, partial [Planctomycetota bacterium]
EEGIYSGEGNRDLDFGGKAIVVRSVDPNDTNVVAATIIDCNGAQEEHHRGFYFHSGEDGNSVVAGFTIMNGYAGYGAGIDCDSSSPVIINCNFINGTAKNWGGGINCYKSLAKIANCTFMGNLAFEGGAITSSSYWDYLCAPVIENCLIIGNTASGSGGGINSDVLSTPTISNCTIMGNSAGEYGGGGISIFQSNPTISNCLIAGNESDNFGGGILQWYDFEDGSKIINCTIARNSASDGGAIRCTSKMTVVNSILWGNSAAIGGEVSRQGPVSFSYCDIKGSGGSGPEWNSDFGHDGGGNIDADPMFALADDYHIMGDSPCVDAGEPNHVVEPNEADLDGNPRILDGDGDGNSTIDMGVFEYNPTVATIAVSSVSFRCVDGGPRPEPQILMVRNCGTGTLRWEIKEDCNWLEVMPTSGVSSGEINEVIVTVDHNNLVAGRYSCVVTVVDPNATNSPVEVRVPLRVGALLRVPEEFDTIQAAIDASEDDDVVLVADGNYTGEGNRDLDFRGKVITVKSENGPNGCVIDCEYSARGFYFHSGEGEYSVVEGFTIINGDAGEGGAVSCEGSSPTISRCIFRSNWAGEGGGIYCRWSSPTIANCIIRNNTSWEGGGILCWENSNPVISNCKITGNSGRGGGGICCWESSPSIKDCVVAENRGQEGGGIHCSSGSNPTITSCTILGNRAEERGVGGGIWCRDGYPGIINCIIAGNTARAGGGVIGCEGSITNCTITGNRAWDRGGALSHCRGEITNCIVWGNIAGDRSQLNSCSEPNYSCVEGWAGGGESNIDLDPCFVEAGYWGDANDPNIVIEPNDPNAVWINGDYHLLEGSPCIDAGDPNYAAGPGETDLDGKPRVADGDGDGEAVVDMGAYEAEPPAIEVGMKITPQTLNCESEGRWVKAHIVLPEGYWPEDIDVNTPAAIEPTGAESEYIKVFDKGRGRFVVEIGFEREAFCAMEPEGEDGYLDVKVTGWLLTGRRFEGTDTIKIVNQHWRHRERIRPKTLDTGQKRSKRVDE